MEPAGISGFGHAFEQVGIQTQWWVENDVHCAVVLRRHHPLALGRFDVADAQAFRLIGLAVDRARGSVVYELWG